MSNNTSKCITSLKNLLTCHTDKKVGRTLCQEWFISLKIVGLFAMVSMIQRDKLAVNYN